MALGTGQIKNVEKFCMTTTVERFPLGAASRASACFRALSKLPAAADLVSLEPFTVL